jgi:septal ring factor EnvC (AmiA/AmiB activator)
MGIKEYQHLRGTMLKVVDLSKERKQKEININNLKTEMKTIKAKLNKKENELRKFKAKDTPKNTNKTKEERERLESEIESFERKLASNENAEYLAMLLALGGVTLPILFGILINGSIEVLFSSCCVFFGLFALVNEFTLEEKTLESVKNKIAYRKRKIKEEKSNMVTPRKLKNLENGISKLEGQAKKTKEKEQSIIQEMIDTEVEINELMDSVAHLIPYADRID